MSFPFSSSDLLSPFGSSFYPDSLVILDSCAVWLQRGSSETQPGVGKSPYKLSLHSGSDKFSVYPLIARAAQGLVHLKTAGTSYLEALRVLAGGDPVSFREILGFSRQRYPLDRASYHVSADAEKVPEPARLSNNQLPGLLDDFDARQVLPVTFGSVMERFGAGIRSFLLASESRYDEVLERHFLRHLEPFIL